MNGNVVYEVKLYINGTLVGDCREIAQDLNYSRKRTKIGADSIDFVINDKLFDEWCRARNYTIDDLLKPMALECRIVRNRVETVGGFLATMPAYAPLQASANLSLHFDGFLNLLGGVYIRNTSNNLPLGTISGKAGDLVSQMIMFAESISGSAGKAYGLKTGHIDSMASIVNNFDNYKTVKEWICDRCDNATGAGPFDVYFDADKTYHIYKESNFGTKINDWVANFPTILNGKSASSISAPEVSGFYSAIIGLGAGDVSAIPSENTALYAFLSNNNAISNYGYYETMYQESSISVPETLMRNIRAELAINSDPKWQPEITLHGKQIAPKPSGTGKIWIGDIITINNSLDLTGMTNGKFRVNELTVDVSSANNETITPVLERYNG